jgi:chemotaxis protein MotA
MKVLAGIATVIGCTIGGYVAMGGKVKVLWQPFEVVIIVGSAIGAYITAQPGIILKRTLKAFGIAMKGPKFKKADFIELLCMQYQVFRLIKSKGVLAIESHIEKPHESSLFAEFPKFAHDHHAVEFFCDYLRVISLGTDDPNTIEDLMVQEMDVHHADDHQLAGAIQGMADGMPALGIVAAVLGVIKTMGSINEPPEILGKMIGGALVGTFLGVWVAYGYIAPLAGAIGSTLEANSKYLECLKTGILAYLKGCAPQVAIEFARKALPEHVRPTFHELEEAIQNLTPVK